jgi:hypothetical protein
MTINIVSAHVKNISGGRPQVDAELGYYIVNPGQNLHHTEEHLQPVLTSRFPSWEGTFGVAPPSEQFSDLLQKYNIFM